MGANKNIPPPPPDDEVAVMSAVPPPPPDDDEGVKKKDFYTPSSGIPEAIPSPFPKRSTPSYEFGGGAPSTLSLIFLQLVPFPEHQPMLSQLG